MMVHPYARGKGGKGGIIRLDDFSLWDLDPQPVAPFPYAPSYGNPELVSKPVPAETPVVIKPTMADKALAKLMSEAADAKAKRSWEGEAGILDGFPYLRNEQVIYLWSGAENGGGILRIRDLRSGKQLLRLEASEATLWKLDLKRSDGERLSYENAGMPCKVKFAARKGEALVHLAFGRRGGQGRNAAAKRREPGTVKDTGQGEKRGTRVDDRDVSCADRHPAFHQGQ